MTDCNIKEPVWFELYTPCRKENEVRKLLEGNGVECFIPLSRLSFVHNGCRISRTVPAMPGIIFAKAAAGILAGIIRANAFIGFRLRRDKDRYVPVTADSDSIAQLRKVSDTADGKITFCGIEDICVSGIRARVKDGCFGGIEGVCCTVKASSKKRMAVTAGDMAAVLPETECRELEILGQ